jgi:radical SAM superfamily enzyme YgiQ (UPF0313 family)
MLLEHNVVLKDHRKVDVRFASCYPNLYRSAMSSLGFHLIYDLLNNRKDVYAERVVYPFGKSLETGSFLRNFDIVGFSLQYEEDFPHVLEMMRKGGLSVRKKERTSNDPLIIAGGPCASSNPLPMTQFIDLFLMGDGEAILPEFLKKYQELDDPRRELDVFSEVEGVWVPGNPVKMALIEDMEDAWRPVSQVVPETKNKQYIPAFGRAFLLEVSRGCARGCRFCMAGCLYRPRREVNLKTIVETAEKGRLATGLDKIALIGAAVSDHSRIEMICQELVERGFQVTTPSLRIESLSSNLLECLKQSGLKTITIAPESTWRLRKVANKPITDDDIQKAIRTTLNLSLNVKLYFMVGLPTETQEDLEDLVILIKDLESLVSRKRSIRISVNPFIPKAHTPFQWAGFELEEIKSKLRYLKKHVKNRNLKVGSPKNAFIQYVLSMGDSNLGDIIEKSSFGKVPLHEWKKIAPHWDLESSLPWRDIAVGINDEYLKNEYLKALDGDLTPWCETFGCNRCGSCGNQSASMIK